MPKKPENRIPREPERASKTTPERPFIPNAQTIVAMEEARDGFLPAFKSIEELMCDLGENDHVSPMRVYTPDEVRDLFNRIDALLEGVDDEDLDLGQELPKDEEDDE